MPRRLDFNYEDYTARVERENYNYQPSPDGHRGVPTPRSRGSDRQLRRHDERAGEVPLLGFGCFFLLKQAQQQGNESYIYGQFLEDCRAGGMPGPAPTSVPGPYIIQLYRDYASTDS